MILNGSPSTNPGAASSENSSTASSISLKRVPVIKEANSASTVHKILICAALFFTVQGAFFCAMLTCSCMAGTIASAASGVAAPGIIPGIFSTCFFGACTMGATMLSSRLFLEL